MSGKDTIFVKQTSNIMKTLNLILTGLMAQNIMLSAWSLGVGSVCLGSPVRFLNDNDICKPYVDRLAFSEGYELCLCVGLGYADESPEAKPRNASKVKYVE